MGCPPEVPVTGERKSVKILGAIELWRTRFDYRQDTVFNACTYLGFLEQLARRYRRQGAIMIQDNASYHKDAEVWGWFKSNRDWLEVHQLPPYSPELTKAATFTKSSPASLASMPRIELSTVVIRQAVTMIEAIRLPVVVVEVAQDHGLKSLLRLLDGD